jgi:hypothetical protein
MTFKFIMAVTLIGLPSSVVANPIFSDTCGMYDREATLVGAAQCAYAPTITTPVFDPDGSLKVADIAYFYGGGWENAGELTANGSDHFLTASSDEGWDSIPNSGDWAIDPSFWNIYTSAVISMHIGAGKFTPDNWAWLLVDGSLGGMTTDTSIDGWSLSETNAQAKGGGLSNIKLWGANSVITPITPITLIAVSEPAALGLLSIGLLSLAAIRRRKKA